MQGNLFVNTIYREKVVSHITLLLKKFQMIKSKKQKNSLRVKLHFWHKNICKKIFPLKPRDTLYVNVHRRMTIYRYTPPVEFLIIVLAIHAGYIGYSNPIITQKGSNRFILNIILFATVHRPLRWVRNSEWGAKLFCGGGQAREGHRHSGSLVISAYNSRQRRAQLFEVSMELLGAPN